MSKLIELVDVLNECRYKVSLISDLFSQQTHFDFSEHSQSGLCCMLHELKASIEMVGEGIESIIKEGSIKRGVPY